MYEYWTECKILPIYFWIISVSIYITSLICIQNYIYVTPLFCAPYVIKNIVYFTFINISLG